jgi:spore coat protein CotH
MPAPKANYVRVVINGESWGIYVNTQQFNKDFVQDWFHTKKGARWKVPGSPGGRGSLAYLGENPAAYKPIYSIRTKEDPKAWTDLIRLCRVLNETPTNQLEEALKPLLDVEGALKFLAMQNTLINNDGYWIRTSDYSIYEDTSGRFHIIPHDMNENFSYPEGPGGGPGGPPGLGGGPAFGPGGPGGRGGPAAFGPGMMLAHQMFYGTDGHERQQLSNSLLPRPDFGGQRGRFARGGPGRGPTARVEGVKLDPLVAVNDLDKPLISKLLAVPALRAKYLGYVRDMAENWLDWNKLEPVAQQYRALIAEDVSADTRKLDSSEEFTNGLTAKGENRGPGGAGSIGIKTFADERRAYLLSYPEIQKLGR